VTYGTIKSSPLSALIQRYKAIAAHHKARHATNSKKSDAVKLLETLMAIIDSGTDDLINITDKGHIPTMVDYGWKTITFGKLAKKTKTVINLKAHLTDDVLLEFFVDIAGLVFECPSSFKELVTFLHPKVFELDFSEGLFHGLLSQISDKIPKFKITHDGHDKRNPYQYKFSLFDTDIESTPIPEDLKVFELFNNLENFIESESNPKVLKLNAEDLYRLAIYFVKYKLPELLYKVLSEKNTTPFAEKMLEASKTWEAWYQAETTPLDEKLKALDKSLIDMELLDQADFEMVKQSLSDIRLHLNEARTEIKQKQKDPRLENTIPKNALILSEAFSGFVLTRYLDKLTAFNKAADDLERDIKQAELCLKNQIKARIREKLNHIALELKTTSTEESIKLCLESLHEIDAPTDELKRWLNELRAEARHLRERLHQQQRSLANLPALNVQALQEKVSSIQADIISEEAKLVALQEKQREVDEKLSQISVLRTNIDVIYDTVNARLMEANPLEPAYHDVESISQRFASHEFNHLSVIEKKQLKALGSMEALLRGNTPISTERLIDLMVELNPNNNRRSGIQPVLTWLGFNEQEKIAYQKSAAVDKRQLLLAKITPWAASLVLKDKYATIKEQIWLPLSVQLLESTRQLVPLTEKLIDDETAKITHVQQAIDMLKLDEISYIKLLAFIRAYDSFNVGWALAQQNPRMLGQGPTYTVLDNIEHLTQKQTELQALMPALNTALVEAQSALASSAFKDAYLLDIEALRDACQAVLVTAISNAIDAAFADAHTSISARLQENRPDWVEIAKAMDSYDAALNLLPVDYVKDKIPAIAPFKQRQARMQWSSACKELLDIYLSERALKYRYKDALFSQDKQDRAKTVTSLKLAMDAYEISGDKTSLLKALHQARHKSPGVYLSSRLSQIEFDLSKGESTAQQVPDALKKSFEQLDSYINSIETQQPDLAVKLGIMRQDALDIIHTANQDNVKEKTQALHLCLHRYDDALHTQPKRLSMILENIAIGFASFGIALVAKLAYSKLTTGRAQFFGTPTRALVEVSGFERGCLAEVTLLRHSQNS